ncbi:MAG TPA: hypothetical protein VEZ89_10800 [Rubrivivax sp.]|nr:hypothetical protein [Rubrivivax sp.]
MKTYNIDIERFKAATQSHGQVQVQVDATVQASVAREGQAPATVLTMTADNARVLQALLKAQLQDADKRKARSQR